MWHRPGPGRIHEVHQFATPAESPRRETGPHIFAERREIRDHAGQGLHPAKAHPRGDDLVEDQLHAMGGAKLAQQPKKFRRCRDAAAIAHHRFDDHGGKRLPSFGKDRLYGLGVIVVGDHPVEGDIHGAAAVGKDKCPAMIGPGEYHHARSP